MAKTPFLILMGYRNVLPFTRITRWHLFSNVHLALDLMALTAAWYLTVALRVSLNPWMHAQLSSESFRELIPHPLVIIALWMAAALWLGSYRRKPALSAVLAFRQAMEADVIACALAIVVTCFTRGVTNDISRSFIFLYGPVSLILLAVAFYVSVSAVMSVESRWAKPKRVAVVGDGADAHSMIENIQRVALSSLTVAGIIVPETAQAVAGHYGFPVLGTVSQLAEVINREQLDQVICVSNVPDDFAVCRAVSHRMGITVSRPLEPQKENVRYQFNNEYGLDLLDAEPVSFTPRQYFVKRMVDILVASLLLLFLSPLLIALAALIRLTSPGPVFYKSPRVGKGGRHFIFWKFRSMYVAGPDRKDLLRHNDSNGHLFKIKDDPRITPLGRFMRRCSLDELPQLINVLKGEMSLVGPRPLPAEDLDPDGLSRVHANWAEQRTEVHPGITGIWQIRGRSDLAFEQMVEFDMDYIRNWSLTLDVQILLETPLAVISGRGAY
jgi:exopolysaccharide biosynthesis polyprenyl glycosylphosphotransferase